MINSSSRESAEFISWRERTVEVSSIYLIRYCVRHLSLGQTEQLFPSTRRLDQIRSMILRTPSWAVEGTHLPSLFSESFITSSFLRLGSLTSFMPSNFVGLDLLRAPIQEKEDDSAWTWDRIIGFLFGAWWRSFARWSYRNWTSSVTGLQFGRIRSPATSSVDPNIWARVSPRVFERWSIA